MDGEEMKANTPPGIGALLHHDPVRTARCMIHLYEFMLERVTDTVASDTNCKVMEAIASLRIGCMEPNEMRTAPDGREGPERR